MSNYDVSVLVNGNRCKLYYHQGKTYVEAKQGSEYEIEIKNNNFNRTEAVCSVDGLDVLTGKTACDKNNGYVIDGYTPLRIKGFRYSNDSVGAFKFELKDNSYAASKGKQEKKNCGVIGIRLFKEKEIQTPIVIHNNWIPQKYPFYDPFPYEPYKPYWASICHSDNTIDDTVSPTFTSGNNITFNNMSTKGMSSGILRSCENLEYSSGQTSNKGFDMGTAWGSKKDSKVITVSFDRGNLDYTLDIYYASRESLIEMGVPISNQSKVSAPQSFPGNYAKPPKNWRG